jgi:phosphoglycerol transferase MdoB-like AlkP superfamily enzyme
MPSYLIASLEMSVPNLPRRYGFLYWLAASYLILNLVSRMGLTWMSWSKGALSFTDLLYSYATGLVFDIASLSYLVIPVVLWLTLFPLKWRHNRVWRAAGWLMRLLTIFALLFQVASEWVFWEEFDSRFNFIAVDYLVYTNEVIGNIRQSYPIGLWLSLCAVIALTWVLATSNSRSRHLLPKALQRVTSSNLRWPVLLGTTGLVLLVSLGLNAQDINQRPNQYANELSGNGLFSLFGAFRNNQLDYQRFYATMPLDQAARLVREQLSTPDAHFISDNPQDIRRTIHHEAPEKHLNVVLITVESLSAQYLGSFGNSNGLTPELDKLANQGMLFTNLYATGNRTVRGLEALSLAVPPTPGQSIVRRPDNEKLFTLGTVFRSKGYQTHFLYGGYGTFDNMNGYFAGNDYQVLDRTALNKDQITQENIWGVADEDLYSMALREFDKEAQQGRPFFAHLMTTSNHRPYTFPDNRIDRPQGKRESAVKYTDWAIGDFLRRAQKQAWAKDTVFVIIADHCASSAGKTAIPVTGYHIPMIIWSPDHIAPQRVDRLVSQMDVAPTLLGLLNFNYTSQFLGQDVFATPTGPERAFIATYQGLGYLKQDHLSILNPKKKPTTEAVGEQAPAIDEARHQQEAIAWYEFASHLFATGQMKAKP